MNYLQRTLAATVLALTSCASNPRVIPPSPEDHRIPNLPAPRIVNSQNEALQIYEAALPENIIVNSDPAERTLEETINRQFAVHIQGDVDEQTLAETQRILARIPALNPCTVYFVPDTLRARAFGVGGWYTISQPYDQAHIVILKPLYGPLGFDDLRHTLPHEFAHRRAHSIGDALYQEWAALNTHPYGNDLQEMTAGYQWRSDPHTGARYGFVMPYAAKNAHEDIASLVEQIRTQTPTSFADSETATILERKRQLLIRYQFIRPDETINGQPPAPQTPQPPTLSTETPPYTQPSTRSPQDTQPSIGTALLSCCSLLGLATASLVGIGLAYFRRRDS